MNGVAAIGSSVTAQSRAVVLTCVRKWPVGLDGRSARPVRGTWLPALVYWASDSAPLLVPTVSCPRCARTHKLVLDADTARVLGQSAPTHAVEPDGSVKPELRCECGWYGIAVLGDWTRFQTLYCAMVLVGNDPELRPKYTHALDALEARDVFTRADWRIVSISPVIRSDEERSILLTGWRE